MTQTIELESIRRLNIKPGETLVVGLPERAGPDQARQAMATLKACIPPGVAVLVVEHGTTLDVLVAASCQSSPASTADA